MILQHLILPSTECGDYRLYTDRDVKGFPVELFPGESVEFRGFMNMFSIDKWRKYTDIGTLRLSLECTGRYSVELHTELCESSSECENDSVIDVPDMIETGLLYVRVTAITDTKVLSGSYVSDVEPEYARIAFDVCTYRRPEYIEKKKETFLKAMDYDGLSQNAEMFIVDNASELDTSASDPRIHVFHNPNTGGSGGISRGIEEIHRAGGFTHIVLMDDDTVLEPECLYRTWSFVSCLKDGYRDIAMAGAMLLADDGCVVYESGAVFQNSTDNIARCRPLKHKLDVSEDAGCIRFDLPEEIDYGGWWYCVYPTSFARPDNLPLRLFMRYDDVEYGLRFGKEFVTLNGISVWHPDFNSRKDPVTLYYSIRNHLILLEKLGFSTDDYRRKKRKDALSLLKQRRRDLSSAMADALRDSHNFDPNNEDPLVELKKYNSLSLLLRLL